jgi:putative transposase
MDTFANWYNHEHRHTGIGLHTPADVHFGLAIDKAVDRTVLTQARVRHPHRFGTTHTPRILDLPDTAWINQPAHDTIQETATTAA